MSTVAEITDAVKELNEEAKGEFLAKLAEKEFDDAWNRQMERESLCGVAPNPTED